MPSRLIDGRAENAIAEPISYALEDTAEVSVVLSPPGESPITMSRVGTVGPAEPLSIHGPMPGPPVPNPQEHAGDDDPAAGLKAQILALQTALAARDLQSNAQSGNLYDADWASTPETGVVPAVGSRRRGLLAYVVIPVAAIAIFSLAVALAPHRMKMPEWTWISSRSPTPSLQTQHSGAHSAASQRWAAQNPPAQAPANRSLATQTDEERALSRFVEVLRPISPAAVPALLESVNERLRRAGSPPCTVEYSRGDYSIVFSPGAARETPGHRPLEEALSRCAAAIEQVTRE